METPLDTPTESPSTLDAPPPLLDRRALLQRAALVGGAAYVAPAILDSFTPGTALAASAAPCTTPASLDLVDGAMQDYILNASFTDSTSTQFNIAQDPFPKDNFTLSGGAYSAMDDAVQGAGLTLSNVLVSGQSITFALTGADGFLVDARFNTDTYAGTARTCGGHEFDGTFTATDGSQGTFSLTLA